MSIILPRDDGRCGWFKLLNTARPSRQIHGKQKADMVIVGSGFVGLAAARAYAELRPDHRVILLEALKVGQGASGRNSGFLIDLPHKRDLEFGSLDRKQKIYRLNLEAIADLKKSVHQHGINCGWEEAGKYQVAVGDRGIGFLRNYATLLDNFDYPYQLIEGDPLSEALGTRYYSQAIYTDKCVLVQPAALVNGLADTLPANVELYEEHPVLDIKKQAAQFSVRTQDAVFSTPKVILATNIFAKEFGYLRSRMIPTMTYASMTRPLTAEEMMVFRHEKSWGATPADHGGTTLRLTQDRRLVIRNRYQFVPRYHDNLDARRAVRQGHLDGLQARYPQFDNLTLEYTWGGACALSRNYQAFFGELAPNLLFSGIHQSVGATRGSITGKLLAQLALGQDSESLAHMLEISQTPAVNPPEPFLSMGVKTRMAYARYESASEL
ncbi:FAD-binding oxidoreductase [Oceanimonas baumannii]|uniref:NAD(P)/FAD-dependent oxidoreductase n=1 Tax=Oceanimonas baumannii TaxID=129578 RepID=UPI001D18945E|nr:FAD-binding oxidoreductase [Oceanimonas baumannii]MCC4266147.1 FAD-binding oxidoreductase [Oceanimonas baumannii]